MTFQITSAYNFVPVSEKVVCPDWQDRVSHDLPLEEGLCVELEVELEAHTPLLVGAERKGSGPQHPVEFYKHPDGTPTVPGSSLRGMLRNVLEIATFARLAPVMDDRALSLRDLRLSTYQTQLAKSVGHKTYQAKARGGWLVFDAARSTWSINECTVFRIEQTALRTDASNIFQRMQEEQRKCSKDDQRLAKTKYKATGGQVAFHFYSADSKPVEHAHSEGKTLVYQKVARLAGKANGNGTGYLVLTGQPGDIRDRDTREPGTKHMEFIFSSQLLMRHDIDADVMREFTQVHEDSEDWKFLRSAGSPHAKRGVPVFFLTEPTKAGEQVRHIGLSQMFRLAGPRSLGAIAEAQQAQRKDKRLDFIECLFGQVNEQYVALKSRVSMGDLRWAPEDGGSSKPLLSDARYQAETVLAQPKPSFHPSYLDQSKSTLDARGKRMYKSILDPDARLRGWKRYPVRPASEIELVEPPKNGAPSNSVLKPLKEGARFKGRIRMHNVTPQELGAVLWALGFGHRTFAEPSSRRHALGLGKPFGFGQVSLRVLAHRVDMNKSSAPRMELEEALQAFESYMENQCPGWSRSEALRELLAMAEPERGHRSRLRPLKLAVKSGGNEFNSAKKEGAVLARYSAGR